MTGSQTQGIEEPAHIIGRRVTLLAALLFGFLAAFLLCAFLFAPLSLTLDGYSHLYSAHALHEIWRGQKDFRTGFSYNSFLIPNWLGTLTLVALQAFLPYELALKVMVVLSVAMLFGSLYYCMDVARYIPCQRVLTLIVLLPFALNGYLTDGFYGFLISSAICFFIFGMLLRYGLAWRRQVAIACLLPIAYFFHPFPVTLSFLFVPSYIASAAFADEGKRSGSLIVLLRQHALALWAWVIPASLMVWFYLRLNSAVPAQAYSLLGNIKNRSLALLAPETILTFSPSPSAGAFFIALVAVLAVAALLPLNQPSPQARLRQGTLAIFLVSAFVLYFLAPDAVGDGLGIANRILLFSLLSLVLLSGVNNTLDARLAVLASALAVVLVFSFGFEYLLMARRLSPALAELRAATQDVPSHSRVLAISYQLTPTCKRWPLLERTMPEWHLIMSAAGPRDWIVLNDYESTTSHFPLRYQDLKFASLINGLDSSSDEKAAAWNAALNRGDPNVDFILSWGLPSAVTSCPANVDPPFEKTLRDHYDPVLSKGGASRVEVWRRRK